VSAIERSTATVYDIIVVVNENFCWLAAVAAEATPVGPVEFHLSRTYRKLGVTSRTELTRHLAATGTMSI
jgi:hypothetical protein